MEITFTLDTQDLTPSELELLSKLIYAGSNAPEDPPIHDLGDEELEAIVQEMYDEGLECEEGSYFRVPELYRKARPDSAWNDLPANARKILGRRFRKHTVDLEEQASPGDLVVAFARKTIQNAALYALTVKE